MGGRDWAVMQEWGGVPWCWDETGGGAGICASAPIPGEEEGLVNLDCILLSPINQGTCKAALCRKLQVS